MSTSRSTVAPRLLALALIAAGLLLARAAAAQPATTEPLPPPRRLMPIQLELGLEMVGGDGTFAIGGRAAGAVVFSLGDGEGWQPFVGVGATGSWGTTYLEDPRAVGGWAAASRYSFGPEVRLGTAKSRDLGALRFVGKAALAWAATDRRLAGVAEDGGARGVRVGVAMANPGWVFRLIPHDPWDKEDTFMEVMSLLMPTELEVTVFRLDDQTRIGGVIGYSF